MKETCFFTRTMQCYDSDDADEDDDDGGNEDHADDDMFSWFWPSCRCNLHLTCL